MCCRVCEEPQCVCPQYPTPNKMQGTVDIYTWAKISQDKRGLSILDQDGKKASLDYLVGGRIMSARDDGGVLRLVLEWDLG